MRYLLDTNVVSDLVRNPQGRVAQRVEEIGEDRVCTSIVVACELRYGATKKGSSRLVERVGAILGVLDVVPLDTPSDATYGHVRSRLERTGRPMGANDTLIAAQALSLGFTVVTDNEREFKSVEGLAVENWLR